MRQQLLAALVSKGVPCKNIVGQTQSPVSVGLPRATEIKAFLQQPLVSKVLQAWAVVDDRDLLAEVTSVISDRYL